MRRMQVGSAIFICLALSFGLASHVFAQSSPEQATTTAKESAKKQEAKEKIGSKSTWEHVVSFPGQLLFFPIDLFLKISEKAIVYVDETKLIPKTIDLLTSDDGRFGVLPTYSSRTGYGLEYFHKDLLTPESKLTIGASAGFEAQQKYSLKMKRIQLGTSPVISGFRIQYQKLTSEDFFFNNLATPDTNESSFGWEQFEAAATVGLKFSEKIEFDADIGYEQNEIIPAREATDRSTSALFDEATLPGVREQADFTKLGFALTFRRQRSSWKSEFWSGYPAAAGPLFRR